MTNEFDILKRALIEHETALKMKNLNQELMEYLTGSIYEVMKYAEENEIPLSKRDKLLGMIEKANSMINTIVSTAKNRSFRHSQPPVNAKNDQPSSEQNPERDSVKLLSAFLPV